VDDQLARQLIEPTPPVGVNGEEYYQVSSVEDSRMYRSQIQYLIWWTRSDSLTWELTKFVGSLQAVQEFHQRHPQKPGQLPNVLGGPGTQEGFTVTG